VFLHFLLLHGVADQNGAGRKAGLTSRVLRMKVRGGEEELGKPMIAQTWSEILVVFSPSSWSPICAKALEIVRAPRVRTVGNDFFMMFLFCTTPLK
jgi:hypothetical protein